jgi:hypothetical protein
MSEKRLREHKDVLSGDSYGDMIAKANLHNSAPDLYAALKTWKYASENFDAEAYRIAGFMRDAALAKAEGKK